MNLWYVLGGIAAVVVFFAIFWPLAGKRIWAGISGQVSKWSQAIWAYDPAAVMQGEIDKYAGEIQEATHGVEEYNGGKLEAQRRYENSEREVNRLTVRVKAEMDKGNEAKALEYAGQLKKAEDDRDYKKGVRERMDKTFAANLSKIKIARQKIEEVKERSQRLKQDLDMSKVEVTTAKLAQKLNLKDLSGSSIADAEEEMHKQISANRGKVEVINALSEDEIAEHEEAEQANNDDAKAILDRFRPKAPAPVDEKQAAR